MVVKLHSTLYDAIEDWEHFERAVHYSIHQALLDLGDRIYDLDWVSMAAAVRHREEELKAAA